ncbi:MAG: hypothetical protein AB7K24_10945 [Gemmataceae bacterium]
MRQALVVFLLGSLAFLSMAGLLSLLQLTPYSQWCALVGVVGLVCSLGALALLRLRDHSPTPYRRSLRVLGTMTVSNGLLAITDDRYLRKVDHLRVPNGSHTILVEECQNDESKWVEALILENRQESQLSRTEVFDIVVDSGEMLLLCVDEEKGGSQPLPKLGSFEPEWAANMVVDERGEIRGACVQPPLGDGVYKATMTWTGAGFRLYVSMS